MYSKFKTTWRQLRKQISETVLNHRTGISRKRLKTKFELLLAGAAALLALVTLLVLITRNYQLKVPEVLHNFLRANHVELSESLFESRLFPVPHLFAERIDLYIDHQVTLQLNGVRLSPDYIALVTGGFNQIKNIHIDEAVLHVLVPEIRQLGWRPGPPPTRHIKDRVMDEIVKISHIVIRQFLVANRFTMDRFVLFVDEVNDQYPLLTVQDFFLKREEHIYIKLQTNMAEWLNANIRISAFLKASSAPRNNDDSISQFSHIAVEIQHRYQLEKIGEAYNVRSFPFRGAGQGTVLLHIPLPMEKIEGYFETIPESVKIGSAQPFLDLAASDSIRISFPFVTDRDFLRSDAVKVMIGNRKWPATLAWNYRQFSIGIKFTGEALPGNVAAVILGSYFDPFIRYITTSQSYLKPDFITIYPLQKRVAYQGALSLRSRNPNEESRLGLFALTGFLRGNEDYIYSNNLKLLGEKTITNLRNFRLDLSKERTISANVDSEIYIGDFYRGARGWANLNTTIDCRTGGQINCKRSDFYFVGSDIQIPVAEAARLYRILSIDVFSYWKSLKKNSEIGISRLSASGNINGDILHIEKSLIDSDTGRIQLTGDYSLSQEKGEFTLRLMPFGVDRVLEPIPLVGSAIQSSLSFATQMIYQIRYQDKKFKVEQFTMGTGFERLRKMFRDP